MPRAELPTPALFCPECRADNIGGKARIGNRRSHCSTCNNFAQNVMRLTRKRLKELHEDEYAQIRVEVEIEIYRRLIDRLFGDDEGEEMIAMTLNDPDPTNTEGETTPPPAPPPPMPEPS